MQLVAHYNTFGQEMFAKEEQPKAMGWFMAWLLKGWVKA